MTKGARGGDSEECAEKYGDRLASERTIKRLGVMDHQ